MTELEEYRVRLLELLAGQPAEYAAAVKAVPEAAWHAPTESETGSTHQIVAHVRDLEVLALVPRLRRVLTEDDPHLEAFPSHHWSAEHYRPDEPMANLLTEFARTRAEIMATLRGLAVDDWSRVGFHPPSGHRTTLWWAERTLSHAREHLQDICRAAGEASVLVKA